MTSVNIYLTLEERRFFKSYARKHHMSISKAFKKALMDKIEDEYDIKLAEEAKESLDKDPDQKFYTHEEFKKMFNL